LLSSQPPAVADKIKSDWELNRVKSLLGPGGLDLNAHGCRFLEGIRAPTWNKNSTTFENTGFRFIKADEAAQQRHSHLPALALAVLTGRRGIAEHLLLYGGADASCVLRWGFLKEDAPLSAGEVMDLFEQTGRDLNVIGDDEHRWSLLHFLVLEEDELRIKKILDKLDAPTVNGKNATGDTPLMLAIKLLESCSSRYAVINIISLLASHSDLNLIDDNGDTVMHLLLRIAPRASDLEKVVLDLLEKGATANVNLAQCDVKGNTALHWAVKMSHYTLARNVIQAALASSQPPSFLDAQDRDNGDTLLVLAMKAREEDFACFLLDRGCSAETGSKNWLDSGVDRSDICFDTSKDLPMHIAIKARMLKLALHMTKPGLVDLNKTQGEQQGCKLQIEYYNCVGR
jgi:ankyrin repeat protein